MIGALVFAVIGFIPIFVEIMGFSQVRKGCIQITACTKKRSRVLVFGGRILANLRALRKC